MDKYVSKSINFILKALLLLILGIVWFGTGADYAYKKVFALPNIVFSLLGLAVIAIFSIVAYKIGGALKKVRYTDIIMLGMSCLFFVFLVVLTYHYYFKTGWDAQMVEWAAKAIAQKDWEEVQNLYFSYYPNNVFLTFLFSLPIRIGHILGISNYYFCIIIFQCFLFAVTGFVIYRAAVLCADVQVGVAVWMLYVALAGLSPWVVVPYSDATGILFPVLLFYLYTRLCHGKQQGFMIFLIAFFSYIGYHIKPQIVIVTIAIVLVTLTSVRKEWFISKGILIKHFLCGAIGLFLGIIIVSLCIKATHLEFEEGLAFGMPHFLMMGLNEEYGGVINIVDQDFSMGFDNVQERNEANLRVAGERLEALGIFGVLALWKDKTLTNFADGTFAWWQEGGFFIQEMYEGNYQLRSWLTGYFYEGGRFHEIYKNVAQLFWMGTLLSVLLSLFCEKKQNVSSVKNVLKLSVIGIILFETFFEARARYLLIYVPLFILLVYLHRMNKIREI